LGQSGSPGYRFNDCDYTKWLQGMTKATLEIREGKFCLTGEKTILPQIEEVFAYRFKGQSLSGYATNEVAMSPAVETLKFQMKPFTPNYIFKNKLFPVHVDVPLEEGSIATLVQYGYAIINDKVLSCTKEERELLSEAAAANGLREQLKVISRLKESNRVEGDSEQIVKSLLNDELSTLNIETGNSFPHTLYKYQREGLRWLLYCYLNKLGTILADDMGLGKTAQAIALIAECHQRKILNSAVIVVPSTLMENWRREFAFFYPTVVPYIHYGSPRTGLAEELEKYKVVILPYSLLVNDIEMLVDLKPDLLVFDEASLLKNPESGRTVAAKRLNCKSVIAITGTPLENSLTDLWSIVDLVFPGYLGALEDFKSRYVKKNIQQTLAGDLKSLETRVRQILIRRLKKDHLAELPERIDIPQALQMHSSEKTYYDSVIADIRQNSTNKSRVLQEIIRLQQFTSHPVLVSDEKNHDVASLKAQSAKLTRLVELLDQIRDRDEKVIIFANHHEMIDILTSIVQQLYSIEAHKIDGRVATELRQPEIDNFSKQPGFGVMVLNPRTAGMGLNITAANHVIHYSRQWNPALEEQATARAYRNGQQRAVNIYYLFYADTIEEVIDQRLMQKKELSENVVTVEEDKMDELEIVLSYVGK
jgi:SNF2 family DNA or RNA helicase